MIWVITMPDKQVRNRLSKKSLLGLPDVSVNEKKTLIAKSIDQPMIWHHQYLEMFLNIEIQSYAAKKVN